MVWNIIHAEATYVELGLAAIAAIMSVRYQAGGPEQKLQSLLLTSATPEAIAMAGAIGEDLMDPELAGSPRMPGDERIGVGSATALLSPALASRVGWCDTSGNGTC